MIFKVQKCLLPHLYERKWPRERYLKPSRSSDIVYAYRDPPPPGTVRLYGANWSFMLVGELQSKDQKPGHHRFLPREFFAQPPATFGDFYQNVFAVDVYRSTTRYPANPFHYFPVPDYKKNAQKVRRHSTLTLQRLQGSRIRNPNLYQLSLGWLEVPVFDSTSQQQAVGRRGLIDKLCRALGLTPEAGNGSQSIYLYPDGFCIFASIALPWRDLTDRVSGWFKVTARTSADGSVTGGLALCFDSHLPGNENGDLLAGWQKAARGLDNVLLHDALGAEITSRPQWLDIARNQTADPREFFWPGRYTPIKLGDKLVGDLADLATLSRPADGEVQVGTSYIKARLTPGRSAAQALASLEIAGGVVSIRRRDGASEIEISAGAAAGQGSLASLSYRYSRQQKSASEDITIAASGDAGQPLELAIPLVETASALRREAGLPLRVVEADEQVDPVGALWTFSPLDNGWLHLPFPDATLAGLDRLLREDDADEATITSAQSDGSVAGGILMGNARSLPGYDAGHREWSLGVVGGQQGWFKLKLVNQAAQGMPPHWSIAAACAGLVGCSVEVEGMPLVTPFRQTSERLLPDHAERALRTRGLRATSPQDLRGIERRMWQHAAEVEGDPARRFVRARVLLDALTITAPQKAGAAVNLEGTVDLDIAIRSAHPPKRPAETVPPQLQPWLWVRHDRAAMMQNLPLARSGEAARMPGGERELLPFGPQASGNSYRLRLGEGWQMDRLHAKLEDHERAPKFTCALLDGTIISELGMASLSLPSLSLFPASTIADDKRLDLPGLGWPVSSSGNIRAGCHAELRHDLAWRDEYHALARFAAEDSGDATDGAAPASESDGAFTPSPDNCPDHAATAAWRDLNRLAATAATDRRHLLRRVTGGSGGFLLTHDFDGGSQLAGVTLDLAPVLQPPSQPSQLVRVGRIALGSNPQGVLGGLPETSDMLGLNGTFNNHSYRFGTADLTLADGAFTDQLGQQSKAAELHGACWVRSLGATSLVSLAAEAEARFGNQTLRFHFCDVPTGVAGTASPATWNDIGTAQHEGLRWWIVGNEMPPEYAGDAPLIACEGGLYFEPLHSAALEGSDGSPLTWRIAGRMGLVRNGRFLPQLGAQKDDKIELVVQQWANGSWIAWLDCNATINLPLDVVSDSPDLAVPPILACKLTTGSNAETALSIGDAMLHFDLFGEPATVPLAVVGSLQDDRFALRHDPTRPPATPATDPRFSIASDLVAVAVDRDQTRIELAWAFTADLSEGDLAARLTVTVNHPAYQPAGTRTAKLVLGESGEMTCSIAAPAVEFRKDVLALAWQADRGSCSFAPDCWLRLLGQADCDGTLVTTLAAKRPDGEAAAVELDAEWRFTQPGSPVLRINGSNGKLSLHLHGGLQLDDARHGAAIAFGGSKVGALGASASVTAHVVHQLVSTDGGKVAFPVVDAALFERQADGSWILDLSASAIVYAPGNGDALLCQLAARRPFDPKTGRLGTPVNSAASFCVPIQPVSSSSMRGARARLGKALEVGENKEGWTDRLLAASGQAPLYVSAQAGEDLGALFAMAHDGKPLGSIALGLPPAWDDRHGPLDNLLDYVHYVAAQLDEIGILAPPTAPETLGGKLVRVIGPDAHGDRIVAYSSVAGAELAQDVGDAKVRATWLEQLFLGNGSRSRVAAIIEAGKDGTRRYSVHAGKVARLRRAYNFGSPWQGHLPQAADPRRSVDGSSMGLALPAGYRAVASRALDLSYRADDYGAEQAATETSIAAHALERSWTLESGAADRLYSVDAGFMLASRQAIAFRPQQPLGDKDGQTRRLTPMLDDGAASAAAAGLVPSTLPTGLLRQLPRDLPKSPAKREQFYAPAAMTERDISGRAGAAHTRRLGMLIGAAWKEEDSVPPLVVGETPFFGRLPRPPEIATADRLRADQFTPRNFTASSNPCFALYGTRAASPFARPRSAALGREPMSEHLWRGELLSPAEGVFYPAWAGPIRFRITLAAGTPHASARWHVQDVLLKLSDRSFPIDLVKVRLLDDEYEITVPADFLQALQNLEVAGECLLRLQLVLQEDDGGETYTRMARVVSLRLPVSPRGAKGPLQPAYLHFEDPALNETLQLPSRLAARRAMAADREKLRAADMLTLAWVVDPQAVNLTVSLTYFSARRDEKGEEGIVLEPVSGWQVESGICAALIDCASLKAAPGQPEFKGLQRGGVLVVSINQTSARRTDQQDGITMRFEVVESSFLPRNKASYALIALATAKPDGPRLFAPLFVQSPAPTNCDLLDPRDLLQGFARFVANERWTYFVPRTRAETTPAERYVLQKISHDGGTYLPPRLADWTELS
ncbi:hypothetical protein [Erythrobacter donghaensis]|uniref:hypothetical protein n=1 Tax=Erythrobacter donghaensis TaxID=267135 RepID=UPI001180CFE4|nr:hypothetical protein [Erythrobacter donghaensis]